MPAEEEALLRFERVIQDSEAASAPLTPELDSGVRMDFHAVVNVFRQIRPRAGWNATFLGPDAAKFAIVASLLFDFSSILCVEPSARPYTAAKVHRRC